MKIDETTRAPSLLRRCKKYVNHFGDRKKLLKGGGVTKAARRTAAFNRRPRVSFDSKVVSDFKSDKKKVAKLP